MNGSAETIINEAIIWACAFGIGLVLFAGGIVSLAGRKHKKDIHYALAAFWEFMASWIMYIPNEVFSAYACPDKILRWLEGILTALLKCFNIYSGNGYERAIFADHAVFSSIYGIMRVSANIAMTLFVGGFILKFLSGPLQRFKLSFFCRRHLYVFSECNEKTLTIARSIPADPDGAKSLIVFACGDHNIETDDIEAIEAFGGIYVNYSIEYIAGKYAAKGRRMEIFLFEDKEEDNLARLEETCCAIRQLKANREIRLLVELSVTEWDMYDNFVKKHALENRNVIVNFVRVEETFVYNNLLRNSIFANATEKEIGGGPVKEIRALIVGGMNLRNIEMFKALLQLSQMPGYFLNLTVIDSGHGRARLWQMMPEVCDDGAGVGDAVYHLNYIEGIDYETVVFNDTVNRECPDFTFAFVNAGDDLLNIKLALQMYPAVVRRRLEGNGCILQVSLVNRELSDKWDDIFREGIGPDGKSDGNENEAGAKGIIPVGSLEETYNYQFITCSEIEAGSEAIHRVRYPGKSWAEYLNNEYNRHSVYARTLSYKYKVQILREQYGGRYELAGSANPVWYSREELEAMWAAVSDEAILWKKYEHMRWDMYTRALGYRKDSDGILTELIRKNEEYTYLLQELKRQKKQEGITFEEKAKLDAEEKRLKREKDKGWSRVKALRAALKIHNDLVVFDELSVIDQIKDSLELTDEIVKILEKM